MDVQRIADALLRPTILQCRMSFRPLADICCDAISVRFANRLDV